MKDCLRFAPMLGARDGELAPEEANALELHLRACAGCRAIAADFAAAEGLVAESLVARANGRDFAPFVDGVMARVRGGRSWRAWFARHRRAAAAILVPVLAALALIVYVRSESGRRDSIAFLELTAEGEVTTILETADGPVVLLAGGTGS